MDKDTLRLCQKKVRQIERAIESELKNQTNCCGISLAQCHTILELGEAGSASISDLAESLYLDKSTLSRTIDGMVRIGLVIREIDNNDRRYMRVTLSEQGLKTFHSIRSLNDSYYEKIFNLIPKHQHQQVIDGILIFIDSMLRVKSDASVQSDFKCCST